MTTNKVVLGFAYGHHTIHPRFFISCLHLLAYEFQRGEEQQLVDTFGYGTCYVHTNRNNVCRDFLDRTTADWLLFLDTDIQFPPDLIQQMTYCLEQAPADVLAIPYVYADGSVSMHLENPLEKGNYTSPPEIETGVTYQLDAAGTGCMLINRKVLVELREQYPEPSHWFGFEQVGLTETGDDITFCRRVKRSGFSIVGWTGIRLVHWKNHPFALDDNQQETPSG